MRRAWLTIRYASFRNSSAVSVQGFLVWGIDESCFESKLLRVGVRSVIVEVAWSEMCVVVAILYTCRSTSNVTARVVYPAPRICLFLGHGVLGAEMG